MAEGLTVVGSQVAAQQEEDSEVSEQLINELGVCNLTLLVTSQVHAQIQAGALLLKFLQLKTCHMILDFRISAYP